MVKIKVLNSKQFFFKSLLFYNCYFSIVEPMGDPSISKWAFFYFRDSRTYAICKKII